MNRIDGVDREKRRAQLCDAAFQFARDYQVKLKAAPGLRLFAQRFGKAFGSIGLTLREGLESDSRFSISMNSRGAYDVAVTGAHPIEAAILSSISAEHGVPEAEITAKLRGSGYKMIDFIGVSMDLQERGLVEVMDGMYFKPGSLSKI